MALATIKLVRNVGERIQASLDVLSVVLLAASITIFVFAVGEFSTNIVLAVGGLLVSLFFSACFPGASWGSNTLCPTFVPWAAWTSGPLARSSWSR